MAKLNKKKLFWRILIVGVILYGITKGITNQVEMSRLAHDLRYGTQQQKIAAARELMERDRLFDIMQEMTRLERINIIRTVIRRMPGPMTVKQCLVLLKDPRVTVRNRVAAALVVLGRDHIDLLVPALKDSDENVRKGVSNALVAIGPPAIPKVKEAVRAPETRAAASDVLIRIGEPSVPAFVELLRDKDQDVRMTAAICLGKIGSMKATPALIKSTRDIAAVRRVAISSLCTICDPRATDIFIEVLSNPDDDGEVRARAARSLSVVGGEKAIKALVAALTDFDLKVRTSVISSLQRVGAPAVGPVVAAMSGPRDLRRAAAAVLEKIDSPEAAKVLLVLASDPDPVIRLSAAKGLGEQTATLELEPLVKLLGDPDGRVAEAAVDSLAYIGDKAIPKLVSVLSSNASDVVKYRACRALAVIGTNATPALLKVLASGGASSKWAAYALGLIGDYRAKPSLEKMAKTADPDLRWTIERALQRL